MPPNTTTPSTKEEYVGKAPYTAAEKQFIKDNWGDEYHFLRTYAMSIHIEEDREEGRAIARTLMKREQEEQEERARQSGN